MSRTIALTAPSNSPRHPISTAGSSLGEKEFHHVLEKGGAAWATLTLKANSALSKSYPTYIQSTPITGYITLDVPKPDLINAVEVTITGRIFIPQLNGLVDREDARFLKLTKTVWTKGDGDGKLCGRYSWDFSFKLPKTATLPNFGSQPFTLPGSMNNYDVRVSIGYQASMTIIRGGLKSNKTLGDIQMGFISLIRPPPFPFRSWECYQYGLPPLEPADDPESWEALKPIVINGTAFKARSASFKCSVYLAKPVSSIADLNNSTSGS